MSKQTTPITGFVFDLDGVITDTAKLHWQAWQELAQVEFHAKLDPALNDQLKGRSRMGSLLTLIHAIGRDGQYAKAELLRMANAKNKRYQTLIQTMTSHDILPGIPEFLRQLTEHGYPLALASASNNAPTIIMQLGLVSRAV